MNTKFTKDDLIHLSGLFEKQSFDELNAELDAFLKLGDNAILLNLKGAMLIAQEKYSEAEEVLDRLISKFDISIDGKINLANVYHKTNRSDLALNILKELILIDELNAETKHTLNNNIGMIYNELSEYDDAILYLNKALELNSNSIETLKGLGAAHRGKYNYQDAITYYERIISIIENDKLHPDLFSEVCMELTQLYRSVYNYAKADEYLKCGPGIISISDKSVDSNLFSQLQVQTDAADNFIGYWAINDDKLMEQIINFFDQNPTLQSPGRSGGQINTDHKKSIDISILPSSLKDQKFDIFSKYSDILIALFNDYKCRWPMLDKIPLYFSNLNIQKYETGGHFQGYHAERLNKGTMHRMFAWMTYLNDVEDGGCTYFPNFDLRFKPKKGTTLIWPSDWTHIHCGEVVNSGEKYIINGWFELT